jgi:prevent-host-death family protein
MRAVTIKEAKAHLNELVDAAVSGQQVVLMRGSKHVAAIVPVTADELELPPRLSDEQAMRLWRSLSEGSTQGTVTTYPSATAAVAHLQKGKRARRRPKSARKR